MGSIARSSGGEAPSGVRREGGCGGVGRPRRGPFPGQVSAILGDRQRHCRTGDESKSPPGSSSARPGPTPHSRWYGDTLKIGSELAASFLFFFPEGEWNPPRSAARRFRRQWPRPSQRREQATMYPSGTVSDGGSSATSGARQVGVRDGGAVFSILFFFFEAELDTRPRGQPRAPPGDRTRTPSGTPRPFSARPGTSRSFWRRRALPRRGSGSFGKAYAPVPPPL